jgi:hypothetical protein
MKRRYHIQITTEVIQDRVSPPVLEAIVRANIAQDGLRGLIGHPEYHFDDNAFPAGWAYVGQQSEAILKAVGARRDPRPAWQAMGRLTHAVQDFYAHSNYLNLWQARFKPGDLPPPAEVNGLDAALLRHPDLRSGRIYYPWEALALIPGLAGIVRRWLPRDAHAWMNLDTPDRGPLFPYALAAARQHTLVAFDRVSRQLHKTTGASGLRFFTGSRS